MEQITRGILIYIVGMGSTLICISTIVGLLTADATADLSLLRRTVTGDGADDMAWMT
jgi:hypothetical protein